MYRLNIPDNRGLYFSHMVKVLQDPKEMAIGMKAYMKPPSFGLLFVLGSRDRPMNIVMNGVRFSLVVMFLRADWTFIPPGLIRLNPDHVPIPIPDDAFYALEIPVT